MGLSVVVITLNEEGNIARCLSSVKWADEILVLDSGSKDKTIKIAKGYTKKIYKVKWEGYSQTKNKGILLAKNDWILSLDADEEITPELAEEIKGKLKEESPSGYFISRRAFFLGKWIRHCGWYPDWQLRLFKKAWGKFNERQVHEGVIVDGKRGYLTHPMNHYSYPSFSDYIIRMNRYTSIWAEEKKKSGRKFSVLRLLLDPPLVFFKMYLLKSGFLDGWHGFILCMASSFSAFVRNAKLYLQ